MTFSLVKIKDKDGKVGSDIDYSLKKTKITPPLVLSTFGVFG